MHSNNISGIGQTQLVKKADCNLQSAFFNTLERGHRPIPYRCRNGPITTSI